MLPKAIGGQLLAWHEEGKDIRPIQLQGLINRSNNLLELSRLLVESNLEDARIVNAFTKRRIELQKVAGGNLANGKFNEGHLTAV
jgi:hypothetical protein